MLKKIYVQTLNVLFWIQQTASWGVITIFWGTEIIHIPSEKALTYIEDVFFFCGKVSLILAPFFWLVALLRLFRVPGLSWEKLAVSISAPVIVFIHILVWYWGYYC